MVKRIVKKDENGNFLWSYERWDVDPEAGYYESPNTRGIACKLCHIIYQPHPTELNMLWCPECGYKIQNVENYDPAADLIAFALS